MVTTYRIFDPGVNRPLHELTRKEAKVAYDHFLNNVPLRIKELYSLLQSDNIELDYSEQSIAQFHDWFFSLVMEERELGNTRPSPELFSVCNDIGIYLSESLKKIGSYLDWKFYDTNRKAISFQRPVIVGFNVKNKNYYVDFDYLVCQYAYRILKSGKKEDQFFLSVYCQAKKLL